MRLEQFSSQKFRRRQELVRRQRHPAGRRPALFSGYCPRGLILDFKGEGAPVWPLFDPGKPQEHMGRGQQKYCCIHKQKESSKSIYCVFRD